MTPDEKRAQLTRLEIGCPYKVRWFSDCAQTSTAIYLGTKDGNLLFEGEIDGDPVRGRPDVIDAEPFNLATE